MNVENQIVTFTCRFKCKSGEDNTLKTEVSRPDLVDITRLGFDVEAHPLRGALFILDDNFSLLNLYPILTTLLASILLSIHSGTKKN